MDNAALAAARTLREGWLRDGPLGAVADWVATGRPPSADALRAAGLLTKPTDPEVDIRLKIARKAYIAAWGYSIPCAEAVEALLSLGPLVEIGAGTGAWTALLRNAGADVVGTDPHAAGDIGYGFQAGEHANLVALTATQAVCEYPERDVFCSWPTEGGKWALGAALALRPGRAMAFIEGSRTGTPGLRRYLRTRFDLIADIEIPQFPGCDDGLRLYRKR